MDIQMPGESGMETFKKLAKEDFNTDTIMISGHGTIETAVEALKHGAFDFLEKPFSIAKLKSTVKTALEKRKQMNQIESLKEKGGTFGNYRLVRKIAEGGMASVYEAIQSNLDKKVALKIMHPHLTSDTVFVKRFEKEAKTTALLSHPGIVQVYDYGWHDKCLFLAMEFISGESLKPYLRKETRLPLPVCVAVGIKLCEALGHAHGKGVVHRDIKPTNILISSRAEVKLVDFGISRSLDQEAAQLTQADQIIGTPIYMSPEQVENRPAVPASDLFSLGTLLYLITTLYLPFTGSNMGAILRSISACEYTEPNRINRDMSPELNSVIAKCLQKDLSDRYDNAGRIREDLSTCPEIRGSGNMDGLLQEFFTHQ
jgi:eukaryotic-like serine/threonine-protein kinase